jgi:Flp pilus assembly protein TadD
MLTPTLLYMQGCSMPRFAPRLLAILMASAALCACSTLGATPETAEKSVMREKAPTARSLADNLEGNVAQARSLRLAGKYGESIQILSQLMLVATDDPRVVAEYGKALAQRGDANDATQFLRRAIELSPNDWTLYSAMGVAYDQINDQTSARNAYERALALRPGEPSVLNNYALSRLLANEPDAARRLIAQAQADGRPGDAKIARNVALINRLSPASKPVQVAAGGAKAAPAPRPVAQASKPAAVARVMPPIPVVENTAPNPNGAPRDASDISRRLAAQGPQVADAAPRALTPPVQDIPLPVQDIPLPPVNQVPLSQAMAASGVVMQAVPFDPLAGPVKPKPRAVAARKPAPVQKAEIPALRVATGNY